LTQPNCLNPEYLILGHRCRSASQCSDWPSPTSFAPSGHKVEFEFWQNRCWLLSLCFHWHTVMIWHTWDLVVTQTCVEIINYNYKWIICLSFNKKMSILV
jgi:hypothetical protein